MLGALLLAGSLATSVVAGGSPAAGTAAATPVFRNYGVADGLPSANVYSVIQDRAGYIWIGTRAGLVRYDSHDFKVFRHAPDQPASLPANDVSTLFVDREGRLWVGGEGTGLNLYEPATGGFRHWLHDPNVPGSLAGNDVWAIAQDKAGAIWVGAYAGGVARLDGGGKSFTHWRHAKDDPTGLASDNITSLVAADDGGLWIGSDAGLQRMDAHGGMRPIALPGLKSPPTVWQIRVAEGGVDIATSSGAFHIDATGNAHAIGPERETQAILRNPDGGWWIANRGGLERVDAHGTIRVEQPLSGVSGSLPGRMPFGLLRDREGGLWVALLDGGLAYLPPQWRAFTMYRHVPGDPASLARDRARALALGGHGALWVGGPGMLDQVDLATGAVRHVSIPSMEGTSINELAEDASGRLWIGNQRGLFVWDGAHLRPVAEGDPAFKRGAWRLLAVPGGTVYAAGFGTGVFRVDARTLAVQRLTPPGSDAGVEEIVQIRTDSSGALWAASHAGLARMAPQEAGFAFVPGVAKGEIRAFAFAPDDTLWVARADRLQHYRIDHERWILTAEIDAGQGWPDTGVFGMQVDQRGRVFALGSRNLLAYDPRDRQLRAFAPAGGLATIDHSGDALLVARDGELFAGTGTGVIGIHVDRLPWRPATAEVALAAVSVHRNGRLVELDPDRPIELDWRDRELAVTARVLSFVDPERNQYRFRLQGFDPGWVDTGLRDVREFSVLDSDDYRLLISGRAGDGPWSAPLEAFTLHVAAAPWTTAWAWTLYALTAGLLLAWVVWMAHLRLEHRHRLAISETRHRLAEQSNTAKSRFLADMAHEIRTPLTGVLGMTELLLKTPLDDRQHQYANAIRRSGALLLRQVNDALDVARIEAGRLALNVAPFDPAAVLREVADADEGLAAQKHLAIDVIVAPDAPSAVRGDALRVKQILFNLAHNALKFTAHGNVLLHLARDADGIVYRVVDHGPGMTREECTRIFQRFEQADHGRLQRGSGLGLAISHELAALMGGRIEVESAPGLGSTFNVRLPLAATTDAAPVRAAPAAPGSVPAQPAAAAFPPRSQRSARRRILLVEDDPVAGEAMVGLIEGFGYAVVLVPHALTALSAVEDTVAFDALVIDFDLPGMEGCELAALLRRRGLVVPIVGVSAGARGDEEQRALDAGMDAFVRKPLPPDDLRGVLQRVLDSRNAGPRRSQA